MTALGPPPAGDAHALADSAVRLARLAGELANAADLLTRVFERPGGWEGPLSGVIQGNTGVRPGELRAASEALLTAGTELERHAKVVDEAQYLHRRAQAQLAEDPAAAVPLAARAEQMVAESARLLAGRLQQGASQAPRPPGRLGRIVDRARTIGAELQLGVTESIVGLFSSTSRFGPVRVASDPRGWAADVWSQARTTASAVQDDPVQYAKDAVDWDTFRTDPARAAGHLIPDLAGLVLTGGTAAGASRATISAASEQRVKAALARNAAANAAERAGILETARIQRLKQLDRAWYSASSTAPIAKAWIGHDGTRLEGTLSAFADAYHQGVVSVEPDIARRLTAAGREIGGVMAGLENSVKTPDSFKRKIATRIEAKGTADLDVVTAKDVARYTIVVPEEGYTNAAKEFTGRMQDAGFVLDEMNNGWNGPRYKGLNLTWVDPEIGVPFEVQVHTPETWQITKDTHADYETMRLLSNPEEVRAEAAARITSAYAKAAVPAGITGIKDVADIHPVTGPLPVPFAPNLIPAVAAAGAAGGVAVLTRDGELTRDTGPVAPPRARPGAAVPPQR